MAVRRIEPSHPAGDTVRMRYRSHSRVSPGTRRRVYERDDWTCQYCGRRIAPQTDGQADGRNAPVDSTSDSPVWLELDHVVPRTLGGTNKFDNLRAACSPCNRRKSDSTQAVDWELRVALAVEILTTKQASRFSVQSAVRALLGVTVHIDTGGIASSLPPELDRQGGAE